MEEPKRRSVLDILESNLKFANRNTFIHRYIYIGEHHDTTENCRDIINVFVHVIKVVNEDYCDERLTGLLLVYRSYFIHILDGSEETLMKHFIICLKEAGELLGKTKLLLTCHHMNQRLYSEWGYRKTKPPILLEAINANCDFETTRRYIETCCVKICRLLISLQKESGIKNELPKIGDITASELEFLPENGLLSFLLDTDYLRDLRAFVARYNKIPICRFYTDCIWPTRGDFVPYDVFDEEKNPIEPLDFS